jgi:hypothetical protein
MVAAFHFPYRSTMNQPTFSPAVADNEARVVGVAITANPRADLSVVSA